MMLVISEVFLTLKLLTAGEKNLWFFFQAKGLPTFLTSPLYPCLYQHTQTLFPSLLLVHPTELRTCHEG